jgi:hypothetical protein
MSERPATQFSIVMTVWSLCAVALLTMDRVGRWLEHHVLKFQPGDVATWVGAVANFAVAIVAVGAPFITARLEKRRKDEARVRLDTRRRDNGSITVVLTYDPPYRHEALNLRVSINAPEGALAGRHHPKVDMVDIRSFGREALCEFRLESQGVLSARFSLIGGGESASLGSAEATLTIVTALTARRLWKRRLTIAPMGETDGARRLHDAGVHYL